MPLGSQQLRRQRTSTLLSLAGVTASLLVIFAQLGIERAVYDSAIRLHRAVVAELVLVPPGFKSLQIHAEVPVAMTDIVATNPAVAAPARSGSASCRSAMPACALRGSSPGTRSTSSARRSTCRA